MPTKIVHDCATGKTEEIELTAQEIAEVEEEAAAYAEQKALEFSAKAQPEAHKESAKAKLVALGLSDAEIEALVK